MHLPRSLRIAALLMACNPAAAQAPAAPVSATSEPGVPAGASASPAAAVAPGSTPVPPEMARGQVDAAILSTNEIRAAVAVLRKDANLGSDHTARSLRWVQGSSSPPREAPAWVVGLFQFLSQTGSLLIWTAGVIALAIAGVWCYRLFKARVPRAASIPPFVASHVGELDITPVSLPDDVGQAALTLLEAGRTRDALSLLYRGALSRAVHRFGVPIGDSFTEREALRAVNRRLEPAGARYFGELVGLWERTVYGGHDAAADPVAALCLTFAPTLGGPAP